MPDTLIGRDNEAQTVQAVSGNVRATFNYIADMQERPVYYNDDHLGGNLRFDPREMEITDASLLNESPRLDIQGFQLFRHKTSQRTLSEQPLSAIEPYSMELEVLLRDALGANQVCVSRRQGTRHQRYGEAGYQGKERQGPPAAFVHSDTSYVHGPTYVSRQGNPQQDRTVRRMAMVNQWRLVSPRPTNMPLAILDARTVSADDLVPADSTVRDRSAWIEMVLLRYNPAHRWYYFSQQGYDDLLVFKQFDSDPGYPWCAPHSAFLNRALQGEAVPRINYETRAAAYWYD